ncbi:MAG: hypothetical protein HFI53_05920 [Lachnospiraceae bacterium]|nr:hypothetical protein [Lachnospiraceae bacterium]
MRRLQTKYRAVIGVLLFYLPFHIFLSPTYWDDATFAKMLGEYHNNLLSYTITRYETWSSRITIELVLPFLTTWPAFIWKTLNLLMIALLYFDLVWIMEHLFDLREKRTYVMTAVLLCAFPFSIMAQTGWIATTTNYLWVIALGLYAINRMLQAGLHGQSLSGREILLSALSIFYCASFESMAAILFLVELGLLLYCKKEKRKCPAVVFLCMGLTILFLLYILGCPGNRLRPVSDARYWMPEFFELTVVDRLRMGVLSSYMHFVSLPSPVFFILNMAVFFSWKGESFGKRLMAAVPVITDVAWTGWFMVNYFMGWRVLTYQVPTPLPESMADRVEQGLLLVTVAAWFAIVLYTLFTRAKGGRPTVVILVLACLPEMAVGITPTVIASILRTMIYLYMAMIILIVALYDSGEEKWPAFGRRFLWFCMGAGVLLNACQIARHIMLYG